MDDVKSMLQSKTVWMGAIGVIVFILQFFKQDVSWLDQNAVADQVVMIVGGISSLLTILFRVKATAKIEGVVTTPPKE